MLLCSRISPQPEIPHEWPDRSQCRYAWWNLASWAKAVDAVRLMKLKGDQHN